jgi:hypothetical protein
MSSFYTHNLKPIPKDGDMEEPYELTDYGFIKEHLYFKEEKIDENIFILNIINNNVFKTSNSECKTKKGSENINFSYK